MLSDLIIQLKVCGIKDFCTQTFHYILGIYLDIVSIVIFLMKQKAKVSRILFIIDGIKSDILKTV